MRLTIDVPDDIADVILNQSCVSTQCMFNRREDATYPGECSCVYTLIECKPKWREAVTEIMREVATKAKEETHETH